MSEQASESTNPLDAAAPQEAPPVTPQSTPEKADQPKESDPYQRLLSAIEGPDGSPKYDSVEKALMSLTPAQEHIRRLEAENEELRSKARDVNVSEEIRKGLEQATTPQTSEPVDLDSKVLEVLSRQEAQRMAQQNRKLVGEKLSEVYGEKAVDAITQKAQELNLPVDYFTGIAEKSPTAFLAYFDSKPTGTPSLPPSAGSPGKTPDETPNMDIMFGASTSDVLAAWRAAKPE